MYNPVRFFILIIISIFLFFLLIYGISHSFFPCVCSHSFFLSVRSHSFILDPNFFIVLSYYFIFICLRLFIRSFLLTYSFISSFFLVRISLLLFLNGFLVFVGLSCIFVYPPCFRWTSRVNIKSVLMVYLIYIYTHFSHNNN